jgi:hypothetical protein
MKLRTITLALASMLGGLMLAGTPGMAESLAGKIGDKRSVVIFHQGEEGSCKQAYREYVAAAGHSAYASTIKGRNVIYSVCGVNLNAPSQKEAEKRALQHCEGGVSQYKFKTLGRCAIMVSK